MGWEAVLDYHLSKITPQQYKEVYEKNPRQDLKKELQRRVSRSAQLMVESLQKSLES